MKALTVLSLSVMVSCSFAADKKAASAPAPSPSTGKSTKKLAINDEIVSAIASGQMDKVKALTKKGISIDSLSTDEQTGLMKLAEEGDETTAEQLLKMGADVNAANFKGETAIWYAVYGGHEKLAIALMTKGAKVDQVRSDSKDCLIHYAVKAQLSSLTSTLKSKTPKCLSQKNADGLTPAEIAKGFGDKKLASELSPTKTK